MIVAPPTASGSSAATTLRNTNSDSRKRIGNASSSARAMSSDTCVADLVAGDVVAADRHAGDGLELRPDVVEHPAAVLGERGGDVGRAPVLRDERCGRRRARSG